MKSLRWPSNVLIFYALSYHITLRTKDPQSLQKLYSYLANRNFLIILWALSEQFEVKIDIFSFKGDSRMASQRPSVPVWTPLALPVLQAPVHSCVGCGCSAEGPREAADVRQFRPRLKYGWNGWFQPQLKCGWIFTDQPQGVGWKFFNRSSTASLGGKGSSGAGRGRKRQRQGARPVGRPCMQLQEPGFLLLSQPLQALPLGHSHRISEDGKWVREGCLSDWGKHTCKQALAGTPLAANGRSAHQPAQQQWPTVGALEFTNNSRQDPHEVPSNSKIIPRPPDELNLKV
jgi:hypothetical protein